MEQEFYRDEFEQLLKDTTDDFKMYPSRKVWHSIYNDLHPDRKWPSMAVCLLLLTGIMYVGVSNNNAINNETRKINTVLSFSKIAEEATIASSADMMDAEVMPKVINDNNQQNKQLSDIVFSTDLALPVTFDVSTEPTSTFQNTPVIHLSAINSNDGNTLVQNGQKENKQADEIQPTIHAEAINPELIINSEKELVANVETTDPKEIPGLAIVDEFNKEDNDNDNEVSNKTLVVNINKNFAKDTREQEWIENFAFHNKPRSKKLFKGLATNFYITPAIGYKVMFSNGVGEPMANTSSFLVNNAVNGNAVETELNQQGVINIEMGLGVIKTLNQKLRFKTGIQFNNTNYITYAQKLDHPTETTLAVQKGGETVLIPYSAGFAHMPGKNDFKLHNRTMQISVPVGLEYKLLSNRVIDWYIGAAAQPTYIADGAFYLLSSDRNYFVDGQDFMRRWNLNGNIESFISLKTKGGAFINLGPQFRYQLFSSFKNGYTYTEKPYSVGFKIGFSRPL